MLDYSVFHSTSMLDYSLFLFNFDLLSRQPAAEDTQVYDGKDHKEDICEKDKDEGRDHDPCVLLPGIFAFADEEAHTGKVDEYA